MTLLPIYVASDQRMGRAEVALQASIEHNSPECEIHWMRAGDPGWRVGNKQMFSNGLCDWMIGRAPGRPYSTKGWATDFTCFRFAVPKLIGVGLAVYMDVDFLVLRDIAKMIRESPVFDLGFTSPKKRTDFSVVAHNGLPWPMNHSWSMVDWKDYLDKHHLLHAGDELWESWDGEGMALSPWTLHYTDMRRQPWKPYPEWFEYPDHPCASLFWSYYENGVRLRDAELRVMLDHFESTEHNMSPFLPVLKELSMGRKTVVEFGAGRSTVAFLCSIDPMGWVYSYDICPNPRVQTIRDVARHRLRLSTESSLNADIPECDLLLIDSSHFGEQLLSELVLHEAKVKERILIHDTVACATEPTKQEFGVRESKAVNRQGLQWAIENFICIHPKWGVEANLETYPGMLILQRETQ